MMPAEIDLDHRVHLHGAPWALYQQLLEVRGDRAVPRISYDDGELELMSPGRHHDHVSFMIARLLVAWAEETGVALNGAQSWTIKNKRKKVGCEADQCFYVGPLAGRNRPDLSIEIEATRPYADKLRIYRKLGVREVWRWYRDKLRIYVLRDRAYEEVARSELLPKLDLDLLLRFVHTEDQTATVRAYRSALRAAKRRSR